MKSTTLNETALRLVALGYDVDTEQFDATGFDVATLDGKRQTAEDVIRTLLDQRAEALSALQFTNRCLGETLGLIQVLRGDRVLEASQASVIHSAAAARNEATNLLADVWAERKQ